ncbi:MAG TPA: M56 family metallopeptidase [Gemmatimonadales bacterium]|nr:M56 family metallopeptidase [Gemmatimonadales bacterium]
MIATWMLYGTVVALLAGLGALALERGARLMGRAGRWCWVTAMVVALALPVAAWLRPQLLPPAAIRIPLPNGTLEAAPPVTITAPAITVRQRRSWTWDDLDRPLVVSWGLLSLALVVWFGVGSWRLGRLRRSWRSEGSLLVSDNVGPAVVGFLRCHVVVPEWSLKLGSDQRELLLAHEAEHLATHDARLLLLSAVVLALVPWNVGLWWQFRRLRLAIELDCDQRVLRTRPDPETYARLLLDVGTRVTRTLMPVTAFYEPMSALERRIRSMTAKRPRGAGILAAGTALGAVAAIFFACEAPRPTAPTGQKASFTFQTHEEEGKLISTFIADSVRRYFGAKATQGPVYLWFIVSPDSHVVRYGTTPRKPGDDVIQSRRAEAIVPGFAFPKMQSITMVGENTIEPGSQPVYWAVLRDPSKSAGPSNDGQMLRQTPWVTEAMHRYYPELLTAKSGAPVEVWFVGDTAHRVLATKSPLRSTGASLGPIAAIGQVFPGLASGTITSITPGAAQGWPLDNVQVVWVTVRDSPTVREWIEREGTRSRVLKPEPSVNAERNEAEQRERVQVEGGPSDDIRHQQAVRREGGMKVVAEQYPQWANRPANPPVTIWVVEGKGGTIFSTHASKQYAEIGGSAFEAELPAYAQLRPGEWFSYFPLTEQRTDVRIVWMHANRGQ